MLVTLLKGCEALLTGRLDKLGCEELRCQDGVSTARSQLIQYGHQLCMKLTAPAPPGFDKGFFELLFA